MSTYRQRHANWTDPLSPRALSETRKAAKKYVEKNYVKRRLGGKRLTPNRADGKPTHSK